MLSNLYAALSQCSQAIVHYPSETELFPEVCRCVVEYGFAKTAWIGFVNAVTRRVEPVACDGSQLSLEFLSQIPMSVDADDPYGRGLTGTAIRTNRPQWTQEYLHDPVTAPWHTLGRFAGWKSSATLPLCRGGVPVDCMVIYSDTPGAFDDDAAKLLFEMATNTASRWTTLRARRNVSVRNHLDHPVERWRLRRCQRGLCRHVGICAR